MVTICENFMLMFFESHHPIDFKWLKNVINTSHKLVYKEVRVVLCLGRRAVASEGSGRALAPLPQFLAEELTLSQPGGRLCPPQFYEAPPPPRIFKPWDGPAGYSFSRPIQYVTN